MEMTDAEMGKIIYVIGNAMTRKFSLPIMTINL